MKITNPTEQTKHTQEQKLFKNYLRTICGNPRKYMYYIRAMTEKTLLDKPTILVACGGADALAKAAKKSPRTLENWAKTDCPPVSLWPFIVATSSTSRAPITYEELHDFWWQTEGKKKFPDLPSLQP